MELIIVAKICVSRTQTNSNMLLLCDDYYNNLVEASNQKFTT